MSVLFVMKHWPAASELWMFRMLEQLEPHLAYVACQPPVPSRWGERVPVVGLKRSSAWRRWLSKRRGVEIYQTNDPALVPQMRKLAASPKVSHVLVHYVDWALCFREVWWDFDKPVFVHCHGSDVTWDMRYTEHNIGKRRFNDDYPHLVIQLATRVTFIAPSHHAAARLTGIGVPAERVRARYLGVEIPAQPPRREPKTRGITVLYLGRLVDCKGPDQTIRAFELACDGGLDGRLVMAGDGPLRLTCELLRARSPYRDRIEMHGAVDRETGRRLRAEADIFTAHSCRGAISRQEEAFGVSFAEAMGDALPIITGRSGGLPEIIPDSSYGLLFEPGDLQAHADGLLRLAANPDLRHQIGHKAWEHARTYYTIEHERRRLCEVLDLPSP